MLNDDSMKIDYLSLCLYPVAAYAIYAVFEYFYSQNQNYGVESTDNKFISKRFFASIILTFSVFTGIHTFLYSNYSNFIEDSEDEMPQWFQAPKDPIKEVQTAPPRVSRDPQFTCDTPPLISRLSGRPQLNHQAVDDCIDRAGICRNLLRALCHAGAHSDPLNACIQQTRNLLPAGDARVVADLLSTREDCNEELGVWLGQ